MSDEEGVEVGGGEGEGETRGQMLQRHKRELMDLKKGKAGRGLSKKDLTLKEKELKDRHDQELRDFDAVLPLFLPFHFPFPFPYFDLDHFLSERRPGFLL